MPSTIAEWQASNWEGFTPQEGCNCPICAAYIQQMNSSVMQPGFNSPAPVFSPAAFTDEIEIEVQPEQWGLGGGGGAGVLGGPNSAQSFNPQSLSAAQIMTSAQMLATQSVPIPLPPKKELVKKKKIVGGIKVKSAMSLHSELISNGKFLYLIRGVSGSGKSVLALLLGLGLRKGLQVEHAVHDLEDFFTENDEDGERYYHFQLDKLPEAHSWLQEKIKKSMEDSKRNLIVTGTFISRLSMLPYQRLARTHGYQVVEIICKGTFESVHGVPMDQVRKTRQGFEN